MRVSKNICFLTLWAAVLFLLIGTGFAKEDSSAQPLLPKGLTIEKGFKPGFGAAVGKVLVVQGEVIIIHANEQRGYRARKDLPLYKNDAVVAQSQGRARLMLNDGSILTLASRTKLVISRSVHEPTKKSRSSFIHLGIGKVRFWVKKLLGYKTSEFKVKTPTAVAGVRGSDFIISATPTRTEVTALGQTKLEVISVAAPDVNPTLVTDFERTHIEAGALPSDVERVTPEEIEQIKQDVGMAPTRNSPQESVGEQATRGQRTEASSTSSEDSGEEGTAEETVSTEEIEEAAVQQDITIDNVVEAPVVLVPETELVMPDEVPDLQELDVGIPPELVDVGIIPAQEEAVLDQQENIMEQQQEEIIETRRSLPSFPGTP